MDLSKIISISGRPGLFQIINQTRGGVLAESLLDGKKLSIGQTQRVSTLADISIYLEDGDEPLGNIFCEIFKNTDANPIEVDVKDTEALRDFLREILPNYDQDRVYASDIKKLVKWYNLLLKAGLIDLENEEDTEEADAKKENKEASTDDDNAADGNEE